MTRGSQALQHPHKGTQKGWTTRSAGCWLCQQRPWRRKEAKVARVVVVGKLFGAYASRQEVEQVVALQVGGRPEGVSFPFVGSPGVFQILLASEAQVSRLLAAGQLSSRQKPLALQRWAPSLSEIGVELDFVYMWAELPRLPPQFFEFLQAIGDLLGSFVSSKHSVKEMFGGARATVCVRIQSKAPPIQTLRPLSFRLSGC